MADPDDLYHAEDTIDLAGPVLVELAAAVQALVDDLPELCWDGSTFAGSIAEAIRERFGNGTLAEARLARSMLAGYCRLSCGWRADGDCATGDTCSCPCDHADGGNTLRGGVQPASDTTY